MSGKDSLNTLSTLDVNGNSYEYYSLPKAAKELGNIDKLPASMKVLLENLLRNEDGETVTREDLSAMADWLKERKIDREIQYRPARVLMQDFTGVPGIVDLAAMRDAVSNAGQNPEQINPLSPVDLVIDHSVMVDKYASPEAFKENVRIEMERNKERYEFL
ncbi:MAG TPA: aconitate hydratase, partial [Idiomarina baltica]|nr:aconitate hydratase [Idiomarina baltica]